SGRSTSGSMAEGRLVVRGMARARIGAVVLALPALVASVSLAAARPSARGARPHPRDLPAVPSSLPRAEPAPARLHVRAAEDRPSSARLGARRFGTGVVFDPRGYAVTVSYVVLDALAIEAHTRDGRRVPAHLVALDLDTGLAVVRVEDAAPWPAAELRSSSDLQVGAVTGTVGMDEEDGLVHA